MYLKKSEWLLLIGLLLLSLVPCVGGLFRLMQLGSISEAAFLPDNPRIQSAPIPVVLHLLSSIPFCLVGAFQFIASYRQRYLRWHRAVGRLVGVAGIVSALSGLWMTHFYAFPEELQGSLLYGVRIFVGVFMTLSVVLGIQAVWKKRIKEHQVWMTRAYALGQGAGTQVIIMIPWMLFVGEEPGGLPRDILMTLAWVINLLCAKWLLRHL